MGFSSQSSIDFANVFAHKDSPPRRRLLSTASWSTATRVLFPAVRGCVGSAPAISGARPRATAPEGERARTLRYRSIRPCQTGREDRLRHRPAPANKCDRSSRQVQDLNSSEWRFSVAGKASVARGRGQLDGRGSRHTHSREPRPLPGCDYQPDPSSVSGKHRPATPGRYTVVAIS